MRSPLRNIRPQGGGQGPLDPDAVVAGLFAAILAREATQAERAPYAAFLAGGGSSRDVVAQLLESPECQLTYFRNPSFRRLVAPEPVPGGTARLYVWHLPKAAGTSLREMLKVHFTALEVCDGLTLSELFRLSPARLRSFRLVVGHFGPMLPQLIGNVPLVTTTLLREPLAVIPSTYHQWRDRGVAGHRYTELARTLSFDVWCRAEEVRSQWSNPQARALALPRTAPAWPGPSESPEGRRLDTGAVDVDELRALAVGYLDGIDIVGTSDDLHAVYRTCLDRLGLAPRDVPTAHENVGQKLQDDLSDDTREWLLAHNTVDTELVTRARTRVHELSPM